MNQDQDLKDILVDGDEGLPDVTQAIANATAKLKEEVARKDAEAKALRGQYDQLASKAAERDFEAQKAQSDLHGMVSYAVRTEHAAIANALAAAEAEANSMQADLAQAIETADGKRAAELQRKIGQLEARRHTLEQGKDRIEEEIERVKKAPAPPQPQKVAPQAADPYEALIAPLPENQKQWLRLHKDKGYISGQQPTPKLLKAYYAAQDAGLREDSREFTVYMDRVLGHTAGAAAPQQQPATDASERFVEAPKPQQATGQQPQKRPIAAAPPSRDASAGGRTNTNGRNFVLTREQHHTAQRLGMTPSDYIKGLQEGIKRGKLQPSVLQTQ